MSQYTINIGALPNDGTGDPLRTAFNEVNLNFNQVFAAGPVLSNVQIANNSILTTNTNGNLVLAPNGIGKVLSATDIVPNTNRVRNLGSANLKWNNLYTQYATISGDATVVGNLTVQGNIIQVGNIVTETLTIQLGNAATTANAANGAGITVGANDNIATILYNSTGNVWTTNIGLSTVGNISAPYFIGNGSQLTGLPAQYSNSNVATFLAAFGSNTISTTGNVTVGNILPAGYVSATGNVRGANFNTDGAVSAVGNVTGNYFVGNGSQLTGIVSSYGNANVVANLAALGSNPVSTTGNVTGGNLLFGTGIVSGTGNITAGNIGITGGSITWANASIVQTSSSDLSITGDGQVTVRSLDGTYQWTFDNAGNLNLPNNGDINFAAGGIKQTLNEDFVITASDDENDGWSIYNVVDDGTGNTFTDTRLSNDQFTIRTDVQGASPYTWAFRDSGVLELPGDIYGNVGGNLTIKIGDQLGSDTFIDLQTRSYVGDALISNIRIANPNVTVSTADAAYTWTFDGTGNLNVPGNSIVSTATATGGAGGNSITIQAGAADQSNFFDTPGGNVNINGGLGAFNDGGGGGPGGDINISSGLSSDPAGHAGNVNIGTGTNGWTFDYTGNVTLPRGGVVYETNIPFGGLEGNTIALKPSGGTNADQQLLVYPTAGVDFNHLHLTTGNLYNTELFLGNDNLYVKLANTGNVVVNSNDDTGNTAQWTFGTNGIATLPGEGILQSINDTVTLSSLNTTTGNANSVYLGSSGGLGFNDQEIGGNWLEIFRNGAEPEIRVPVGLGNLNIQTASGNTPYNWTFDDTGNLTVPGNIVMPPGSSLVGNGASPAPSISGFSNGEFGGNVSVIGNVSAGNISASGNITGNTAGYAIGYRDIPQVSFTGNATIATTDAGKHFYSTQSTNYTLTIANNASQGFQVGAAITIVNQGTGNITVAQGSGITLYLAGNVTAGNRTVATFGMATIMKVATDTWFINGTGVS
jgi:hypothetical protein